MFGTLDGYSFGKSAATDFRVKRELIGLNGWEVGAVFVVRGNWLYKRSLEIARDPGMLSAGDGRHALGPVERRWLASGERRWRKQG